MKTTKFAWAFNVKLHTANTVIPVPPTLGHLSSAVIIHYFYHVWYPLVVRVVVSCHYVTVNFWGMTVVSIHMIY